MMGSRKKVKDYQFGQILSVYRDGIEVSHASKKNIKVVIYSIKKQLITNKQQFPIFNQQIVENKSKIYPQYYQLIQSQNNVYLIFEDLSIPTLNKNNKQQVHQFLISLQEILFKTSHKLEKKHIFMRSQGKCSLRLIPNYQSSLKKTSSLYSRFNNKSAVVQVFCDAIKLINQSTRGQLTKLLLNYIDKDQLFQKIDQFLGFQPPKQNPPPENVMKSKFNDVTSPKSVKKSYYGIMDQAKMQYPEIDEEQFRELIQFGHYNASKNKNKNVNNNLIQAANQAYMNASNRQSFQQVNSDQQIDRMFESVKESVFHVEITNKTKKSKYQLKIQNKYDVDQFEIYYNMYVQIFSLFDKTYQSYINKYPTGFSGIIAAYLICLIGALRRLKLYVDLRDKEDIFQLGSYTSKINYEPYMNNLRQQLAKQAKRLVKLRNLIENVKIPTKAMMILMPFLDEEIETIDLHQTQKYCYSFMRKLLEMRNKQSYHQILVLQTIQVILNQHYRIVYSEDDSPKQWNAKYYDNLKAQVSALVSNWVL